MGADTRKLFLVLLAAASISGCSSCVEHVTEKALRAWAVGLCEDFSHESGSACRSEVERRFPGCRPPVPAGGDDGYDVNAFMECLGFEWPPAEPRPIVLGSCDAPDISAEVTISEAKSTPSDSSTMREIGGTTL